MHELFLFQITVKEICKIFKVTHSASVFYETLVKSEKEIESSLQRVLLLNIKSDAKLPRPMKLEIELYHFVFSKDHLTFQLT